MKKFFNEFINAVKVTPFKVASNLAEIVLVCWVFIGFWGNYRIQVSIGTLIILILIFRFVHNKVNT